jgi:hypothetical protein
MQIERNVNEKEDDIVRDEPGLVMGLYRWRYCRRDLPVI